MTNGAIKYLAMLLIDFLSVNVFKEKLLLKDKDKEILSLMFS